MEVVERYLLNVRTYLPSGRQDDLVAGRYRADGRRLVLGQEVIGPALFPFFRISLLAIAAVTGLVLAFGAVAAMIGIGRPVPWFRTAVFYLSLQFGIATVAFAAMEVWFRRTAQTWDPRRLPVPRRPPTPTSLRVQALVQIAFTLLFLWVWVAIPDPLRVLGPALVDLRAGPAWRFVFLGALVSTLVSLATPSLTLLEPSWRRFRWIVTLFSSGVFIAFAFASLWNGAWVLPASAPPDPDTVELAQRINSGFILGLGLTIFATGLSTVFEVVRGAWREYRATP